MSVKTAKLQFNGGELSPWLAGRLDIAKYNQTAKLCRNFIPLVEGSLKRRGGTRFVAQTPERTGVSFNIIAYPKEAEVVINDCMQTELTVAIGDTVNYEVRADGYVTTRGKVIVAENTTLEINLVSLSARKTLTIAATPVDATVKIAGLKRSSYKGYANESVPYMVYKNGYAAVTGTAILDGDKTLTITLNEHSEDEGSYGDWGNPVAFIACSAYGAISPQKKCFLIRFENGYLPILFDAHKTAPVAEDFDESLFMISVSSGFNALFLGEDGEQKLAVIRRGKEAVFYDDLAGNVLGGFITVPAKETVWQTDEQNRFATIYQNYDGYVVGKTIKVYCGGELVWCLKGRNNG